VAAGAIPRNPWLDVPAADGGGHMAHPAVGQATLLARVFAASVARFRPARILVPGCATGNGLECLRGRPVARITAVDLQPGYLDLARRRHATALPALELVLADLEDWEPEPAAYDLAYCALVLEYLAWEPFVARLARALAPGGTALVLLQLPAAGRGTVSDTPYASLRTLEPVLRLVDPDRLRHLAPSLGLAPLKERTHALPSGKAFLQMPFRKAAAH